MEKKQKVIYDSITGMTKEELTRFLAMVAPAIACRMCPYWDVSEERCFADRDFACTNEYASSLIAKYLECPVDGAHEEKHGEIEKCPFCGGLGEVVEPKRSTVFPSDPWWRVQCRECFARGSASDSKSGAIRNWNRRWRR